MRKSFQKVLLAISCVSFVIACQKTEVAAPPPPEVKVATVLQKTVPIYVENIGETVGAADVEIRARVEGFLQTMDFEEGSLVRKDQLLYTIDPKQYEAALATAAGRTAEAQAQLSKAQQDVARFKPLVEINAISRQEYETAVSAQQAAAAALEAAKALEDNARIDLGYCKVYAPIDGLIGKSQVKPGNLVGRGESTLLAVVSKIDTIHVRSNVSERDYLRLARAREASAVKPKDNFELVLADGSVFNHKGSLVFADRAIDPATGTLGIEATFPNPEGLLRPGQYARLRVAIDTKPNAILVPQGAVSELQGTYSVAVVSADNKVSIRPVQAGDRIGSLWLIDSGLKAGDRIVVEGVQKVREGTVVTPVTVEIKDTDTSSAGSATQEG